MKAEYYKVGKHVVTVFGRTYDGVPYSSDEIPKNFTVSELILAPLIYRLDYSGFITDWEVNGDRDDDQGPPRKPLAAFGFVYAPGKIRVKGSEYFPVMEENGRIYVEKAPGSSLTDSPQLMEAYYGKATAEFIRSFWPKGIKEAAANATESGPIYIG